MRKTYKYEMKPLFERRMRQLLPDDEDFEKFERTVHTGPQNFIRCNTLKTPLEELLARLKKKWEIEQPFPDFPEIILINSNLLPGELGNSLEHLLGYYYIQEISSLMPVLALDTQQNELVLDLFAAPGSKTTQMAARMKNAGTIIANDLKIGRISVLVSNLEKCGVANTIVTRKDAVALCSQFAKNNFKFDKILLDAPCSGEGTLRSSPKMFLMWNEKVIRNFSRMQKKFLAVAVKCLKKGGTLVYSTCTHAPEENEEVVSFALENFPLEIETVNLPLKCRAGILNWEDRIFNKGVEKSCRIYPHDNDSEGFFVAKFRLKEEVK